MKSLCKSCRSDANNPIQYYLYNREQSMKVNDYILGLQKVTVGAAGVPQESSLWPLLFIMSVFDFMTMENRYL